MSVSSTQQELARALELGWRFWLIKVVVTVFVYGQEEDCFSGRLFTFIMIKKQKIHNRLVFASKIHFKIFE
jgi:hypothetical protein